MKQQRQERWAQSNAVEGHLSTHKQSPSTSSALLGKQMAGLGCDDTRRWLPLKRGWMVEDKDDQLFAVTCNDSVLRQSELIHLNNDDAFFFFFFLRLLN